ncbi:MAG TPA: hypothetical protein ENJ18_03025 [Nannocystis exedens]|nr:hypothetical protein [Nannocystis exedens]
MSGSIACAFVLTLACGDASEAEIGPEGGELRTGAITVVIPPGAMGTTRVVKISQIDENLGRSSVQQIGDAYLLEPTDLKLRIPATVTVSKLKDATKPTLLHIAGDTTKVHTYAMGSDDQAIGYIGAFGKVAGGEGSDELATVSEPMLEATPELANASAPFSDSVKIAFTPKGLNIVDLVLTAYDLNGENNRDLNGNAYCAFKPSSVQGASIATGCSTGTTTVALSLTSASVELEAIPFLLGKVDSPVIVQVEIGSQELVNTLGYFAFNTSPCYYETCSGYGTCVETGGVPSCECTAGYVPAGENNLECACAPQCAGRECGSDSCGGSCSPGCGDGFDCNDEAGVCESDGSTTGDSTTTTTSTSTSGDTSTSTSGGTSTGGSTSGSTGGSTGGSSSTTGG